MDYEDRVRPASSKEERDKRIERQRVDAKKAMEERRRAEDAFRANYERLKAERIAREAQRF